MYFTSNAIETYVGDRISKIEQLLIIILIEHIIIAIKVLLAALIKDVPKWVEREEQEQKDRLDHLYNVLDEKKDEYIAKGGVVLEAQIQEMQT